MYKSSFTRNIQASRHKSQPRSKSVAARLPANERAAASASSLAAVASASSALTATPASSSTETDFPPKDYKEDIMKLIKDGYKKWLKYMPPLAPNRAYEWDLIALLAKCNELYESLDPSIRLIPSQPASLVQRKKTLACNIAWSVAPYEDVNEKKRRSEFNRLFGAHRTGPTRLTDKYVPDDVKARVEKMANKKKNGKDESKEDAEMGAE